MYIYVYIYIGQVWWLALVIPATWEAEIKRREVKRQGP
jgi:hypothetical protein